MSAIVGYRDQLLQAAPVRNIAPAADAFLLLTADTPVFHVTLDGAGNPISGSPAVINLTTTLFNLDGAVTWAVVSGTAVLTGTGNTRQLAYATMTTDTATVRASTTYSGVTFQMELIISKVRDGANGIPGSPGTPGSPGSPGATGKSARIAFTLVNGFSLNYNPQTVTVSGDTKPVTGTWGETAVWKDAIDSAPDAGQAWFQSNGTYDATAGVNSTVWRTPYMSNLKVGSLEAISVNTGALIFSDTCKSANGNVLINADGTFNLKGSTSDGSLSLTGTLLQMRDGAGVIRGEFGKLS